MENSKHKLKYFYEHLYSKDQIINPALLIYDRLRINKIINSLSYHYSTGRILIIGCGAKNDVELLDQISTSFAFDLSYNAIKNIKTVDRKLFVADATNMPLANDKFDIVVMWEVIEHIPEGSIVVREISRSQKPLGKLILSTPNWISWFGLARWISKVVLNKEITSDNQPYDDWKTITKLKKELAPYFTLLCSSGIWYLPPLHYKKYGLSKKSMKILFKIFSPIENFLSRKFPHIGHLLFTVFVNNKWQRFVQIKKMIYFDHSTKKGRM